MNKLHLIIALSVLWLGSVTGGETNDSAEVQLKAAMHLELVDGDLKAAIEQYKKIMTNAGDNRSIAAKALLQMGQCYEKLGLAEARHTYERVVRDFADQQEIVGQAHIRLAALEPRAVANHETAMTTRRLWAGHDVDDEGAPSPDGRYLSYVDWETGSLAIRDLTTGERRRLVGKGSWDESGEFPLFSIFSPDGKQVAYAWWTKDNSWDLRIVSVDDPKSHVLYGNQEVTYVQPAQWSPDGKYILALFTRKDNTNQIVLVSVADGSTRVLKTLDWRAPQKMSFSPDGRYIAFDFPPKEDSPDGDIFVLAVDGSRETPLVEHPANDLFPVWTPDGKNILFISDRTGTMGLWALPVADGKAQGFADLIKPDIGRVFPMGFTRKGSYFYGLETGMADAYVGTLDLATGKMQAPPSKVTQRYVGSNSFADWSPDGRHLAYISNRSQLPFAQGKIICIRLLESGEERELRLRPALGYFTGVRWSPDSRSLLTSGSDRKGRAGVFRIDAQTGEVNLIVREEPDSHLTAPINAPMWSPDGKAIFYVHSNLKTKITRLLRRDLESGQEKEIVRTDTPFPGLAGWTVSLDGSQIVFQTMDPPKKSTILKIVATDGGEPRELLRTQEFVWLYTWTPDGRELIFANKASVLKAGQPTELWRMPVMGGKPQKLDLGIENLGSLRFHPDGQRVAFNAGRGKAEVWVMENFLPVLSAAK